ncbi:MAG: SDR family oxidoreductase [Rhodobacteraceae bacterium]|nr:SDR family oxidoreductase [Paracoccaceae bacterium]
MFRLDGKKALVVGIANAGSIAWGCAKAFRAQGADVAVTYLNEKAEPHVRPLAEEIGAEIVAPLDVQDDARMAAVFAQITERRGELNILLHAIAVAPWDDLHGRVVDCLAAGFSKAMDISVHSFLRMIKRAEPPMTHGGTCMTVSFLGAARVIGQYKMMGPVKAALESAVRYAAVEPGPKSISVHALSPGPLKTSAASSLASFDALLGYAACLR